MAGQTVAVTGATGFIGTRLVRRLVADGHDVRALVRDPGRLRVDGVAPVKGALERPETLEPLCRGVDRVIHLAGLISGTQDEYDRVNAAGTTFLVAAAKRHGVRRFVHLSSLAAREPTVSDYGASKLAGEAAVEDIGETLSWVIVRPPAVYGPGDRGTLPLIRQLTRRIALIPGRRENRFSLIHVDDLVDALVEIGLRDEPAGTIHEVHDGRADGYGWDVLAGEASKVLGHRVRCCYLPMSMMQTAGRACELALRWSTQRPILTAGKVRELYHPDWVCRNGLLDEASRWRPRIGFASGFAATVQWYRQHAWI